MKKTCPNSKSRVEIRFDFSGFRGGAPGLSGVQKNGPQMSDQSPGGLVDRSYETTQLYGITLQGINISHLGKRKIIFKMPFWGDMLVPWRLCYCKDPY